MCVRETGCAHFGLLMGQYVNIQTFGVAGRVARNAPSVGAALNDLAAYFVLHDNGGSINVSIHEGSVTLSYGVHVTGLRNADQVYDLAVAAMVNVMRQLCGAGVATRCRSAAATSARRTSVRIGTTSWRRCASIRYLRRSCSRSTA